MASMHFWGVEVKGKEPKSVTLEDHQVIHISQATLGELKKDNEPVIIHLKVGDKKLVMGVLSHNTPQLSFDLVIEQDFEISHNWKNGSVHFLGYDSDAIDEELSDFSDEDLDVPAAVPLRENGKPAASAVAKAPAQKANKDNKAQPEQKTDDDDDDDSEDDDDDDDDSEDDDSDEEMAAAMLDSDDDDDDDDDSDEEETPKPDSGKKRSKPVLKTPESKKAKLATPQKTDGKKGGAHVATPHPSKKAGKSSEKSSPKSKSGGKLSCGPCNKSFTSEVGLQSHNKAKHSK